MVHEPCIRRPVQIVEKSVKSHSNQHKDDRYIVESVIKNIDDIEILEKRKNTYRLSSHNCDLFWFPLFFNHQPNR